MAGKYLRILFDLDYTSHEGVPVSIREGEKCLLLKKTNSDWWSVMREGEKKPIYVPANYVEDIVPATSPKPKKLPVPTPAPKPQKHAKTNGNATTSQKKTETNGTENTAEKTPAENKNIPTGDKKYVTKIDLTGDKSEIITTGKHDADTVAHKGGDEEEEEEDEDEEQQLDYVNVEGLQKRFGEDASKERDGVPASAAGKYEAAEYANLAVIQESIHANKQPNEHEENGIAEGASEYTNVAELQRTQRGPPPAAPAEGVAPAKVLDEDWGSYSDPKSGRLFYYNRTTGETTWKPPRVGKPSGAAGVVSAGRAPSPAGLKPAAPAAPPRGRSPSPGLSIQVPVPESPDHKTEKWRGTSPDSPLTPGWKAETTSDGDTCYVSDASSDKWLSSVDDEGQRYFYKKGTGESTWHLPEITRQASVDTALPVLQDLPAGGVAGPSNLRRGLNSRGSTGSKRISLDSALAAKLKVAPPPTLPASFSSGVIAKKRSESPVEPADAKKTINNNTIVDEDGRPKVVRLASIPDTCEAEPEFPGTDSGFQTPSMVEKKDFLNRTKVLENGKKLRKNWAQAYVVTNGSSVFFYKDPKSAQPKPGHPHGKPEGSVDLKGAKVEFGNKEKSSRKNVIQVTSMSGTGYLLQTEDSIKIHDWYISLLHNTELVSQSSEDSRGSRDSLLDHSMDSEEGLEDLPSPDQPPTSPATDTGRGGGKKKKPDKGKKGAVSSLERGANLEDGDKSGKIKEKLRFFFLKRPGLEALQEKGIIRYGVFGSTIPRICEREKSVVPRFVAHVTAEIERRGLNVDGLYRVSGNLAQIQRVRFMVETNEKYNFDDPDWDIHVLTGSLKLFFRELKEPLFPFRLFNKFLDAIKTTVRSERLRLFKDLIKSLPRSNRETMKLVFAHLLKVIERSRENRMQIQNVAIVFGPTLMWPEVETANVAVTMVCQNQIVEFILHEYKQLF